MDVKITFLIGSQAPVDKRLYIHLEEPAAINLPSPRWGMVAQ